MPCPGRLLAENMLWLESACLLATFTFSPAKGEDGKEIDIQYATKPKAGFIQYVHASMLMTVTCSKLSTDIRLTSLAQLSRGRRRQKK